MADTVEDPSTERRPVLLALAAGLIPVVVLMIIVASTADSDFFGGVAIGVAIVLATTMAVLLRRVLR